MFDNICKIKLYIYIFLFKINIYKDKEQKGEINTYTANKLLLDLMSKDKNYNKAQKNKDKNNR